MFIIELHLHQNYRFPQFIKDFQLSFTQQHNFIRYPHLPHPLH